MSDPIFETNGIEEKYLWMWYCSKCHSTLPPFVHEKEQPCPYCGEGTLQKVKVDEISGKFFGRKVKP
jgi:rRNA maturation endonuclease Nob1